LIELVLTYLVTLESCFWQGELEVVKEVHRKHIVGDEQNGEAGSQVETRSDGMVTETSRVPFLMLGLDLPPPPLFKDAMEKNIIPQVCFPVIYLFTGIAWHV
jgi:U4/U6.U5 tri-snRNP-associated protein 2